MTIRRYEREDLPAMRKVFLDALYKKCSRDYTKEQLDAWASGFPDDDSLDERFTSSLTLIAEKGDRLVGFANLEYDYVDMLYVVPDYNGNGVGSELLRGLEAAARRKGIIKLSTCASATAKTFFTERGWSVARPNIALRQGIVLQNYVLEKLMI